MSENRSPESVQSGEACLGDPLVQSIAAAKAVKIRQRLPPSFITTENGEPPPRNRDSAPFRSSFTIVWPSESRRATTLEPVSGKSFFYVPTGGATYANSYLRRWSAAADTKIENQRLRISNAGSVEKNIGEYSNSSLASCQYFSTSQEKVVVDKSEDVTPQSPILSPTATTRSVGSWSRQYSPRSTTSEPECDQWQQSTSRARGSLRPQTDQFFVNGGNETWKRFVDDLKTFYRSSIATVQRAGCKLSIEDSWHPLIIQEVDLGNDNELYEKQKSHSHNAVVDQLFGEPKLAIVSGDCGSGKTFLAKKLLSDWTEGLLQQFSLVLFLPTSFLTSRLKLGQKDLPDIFVDYLEHCGHVTSKQKVIELLTLHFSSRNSNCSTLLILDSTVITKNPTVVSLKFWQNLPCHTLLLTNRHLRWIPINLCKKAQFLGLVQGFSSSEVLGIVHSEGDQKLQEALAENEFLQSVCRNPQFLYMIIELCTNAFLSAKAQNLYDLIHNFIKHRFRQHGIALGVVDKHSGQQKKPWRLEQHDVVKQLGQYAFEVMNYSFRPTMDVNLDRCQVQALIGAEILSVRETGHLSFSAACFLEFFAALYVTKLLRSKPRYLGFEVHQRSGLSKQKHRALLMQMTQKTSSNQFLQISRDYSLFRLLLQQIDRQSYAKWFGAVDPRNQNTRL